jgi:hypothetical protein
MSKTIVIMDAPDNAASIEQIGDENPYFLGAFGEVITLLRQAFPEADFSDPTDITANTNMGKISIEIAKHTPVQSFMLHLEQAEAVELVQKLCEKTKWRALDTDTGQFIDMRKSNSINRDSNANKSWWKPWKK